MVIALPVPVDDVAIPVASEFAATNAWDAIKSILFDDDAKAFADFMKSSGVPAPNEDNIGYEVVGTDGEVIATVEIAWPDRCIGFMTVEQAEDKKVLEKLGWNILSLFDAASIDIESVFGGDQ